MSEDQSSKHSAFTIWLKMGCAGFALLTVWFLGSYAMDFCAMPTWLILSWTGIVALTWLVGGNYYFCRLHGGPTKADYIKWAVSAALLIVAGTIIATS